ncbi:MAG: hypothetical protein WEA34_14205 [Gemmatimonadota bacterium]
MRTLPILLSILALGVLATPRGAEAQVQIGPTLAYHDDFDVGVGGTLNVQMPALGDRIGFMADVLVFFPDMENLNYLEFNGNVTYDFPVTNENVRPFALVGLNVARVSVDAPGGIDGGDNTEIGLNLGGGIGFDLGALRPTVGARLEISGGEGFVLFLSVPFEVGSS